MLLVAHAKLQSVSGLPNYHKTWRGSASHRRKRRKQNHKISFHFFSGSPHTPRRKWIGKEIYGFVHATAGSVRGAQDWRWQALRAYDWVSSHHALGACVSRQNPADFAHTLFELRPKNTARHNSAPGFAEKPREGTRLYLPKQNWGRAGCRIVPGSDPYPEKWTRCPPFTFFS